MKNKISRRNFCQNSLLSASALALPASLLSPSTLVENGEVGDLEGNGPEIIDTFVQLMEYPFRHLKYASTSDIVQKLRKHKITKAWAGSYEALFHKNIDLTNRRLLEECSKDGNGMMEAVGSVNTTWPDWEEDLRRCKEDYQMNIIRIYPIYQMIEFNSDSFLKLVELATQYGMLIQIVGDIEDRRHHHPLLEVRNVSFDPLLDIAQKIPAARIQLLHWNRRVSFDLLGKMISETKISFDISRIEGAGEVGGLLHGTSWYGMQTKLPAERLLFGSYAPYFPVESALLKLFESPLNEFEMKSIMRENAIQLLKKG